MTDWWPYVAGLTLFFASTIWLLVRGRGELVETSTLSRSSFVAMVTWYLSVIFTVGWAAWTGAWPLPFPRRPAQIIGGSLAVLGEVVHLSARSQCRTRATWSLQMPRLITTGIYTLVRHPQNLGWGLLVIGIAVWGRSGAALLIAALYSLVTLVWLPAEDAALDRRFGAEYRAYRMRTSAVIPFLSAFRKPGQ